MIEQEVTDIWYSDYIMNLQELRWDYSPSSSQIQTPGFINQPRIWQNQRQITTLIADPLKSKSSHHPCATQLLSNSTHFSNGDLVRSNMLLFLLFLMQVWMPMICEEWNVKSLDCCDLWEIKCWLWAVVICKEPNGLVNLGSDNFSILINL